jgi:hypothetical protein
MKIVKKRKNRQAVRKLLEELTEVLDAFGWYGVGGAGSSPDGKAKESGTGEAPIENLKPSDKGPSIKETPDDNSSGQKEISDDEASGYDSYDEEDDYSGSDSWYYDPWDVQSALDAAISNLIKTNLVPEFANAKDAPSFSEVCDVLFGSAHELTKQAEYFEELIKGYEERVSKDDLREAYATLESIMEDLGWNRKPE